MGDTALMVDEQAKRAILNLFVSSSEGQFAEPWKDKDHSWATDRHTIVRGPEIASIRDKPKDVPTTEQIEGMFFKGFDKEDEFEPWPWPEMSGQVCEHCHRLKMAGFVVETEDTLPNQVIGGEHIQLRYIGRVLAVGNILGIRPVYRVSDDEGGRQMLQWKCGEFAGSIAVLDL